MTKLIAKEGFVWRNIEQDIILSRVIYLGVGDSPENYEEVEKPIEE